MNINTVKIILEQQPTMGLLLQSLNISHRVNNHTFQSFFIQGNILAKNV